MPTSHHVPEAVHDLARQLSHPKPMRRGTFSEQYLRCNKPGCPCANRNEARHGPYYRVVRIVRGRTQSHHVPAERAPQLRQQVEAGQQFRKHVEEYWRACEQWADAQLEADEAVSETEAAKKGGPKRRSKPRSSPRSKRS